jgi:ankyrin repeat protein
MESISEALLQAGCDVNAADSNGFTPLMYAARYRRYSAVRLLLIGGANINAREKGGKTALDIAKTGGDQRIISLLESPHVQSGSR